MAKEKVEEQEGSSLEDFQFGGDGVSFFGRSASDLDKEQETTTVGTIITGDDDDDDSDFDSFTEKPTPVKKSTTKKTTNLDEEQESFIPDEDEEKITPKGSPAKKEAKEKPETIKEEGKEEEFSNGDENADEGEEGQQDEDGKYNLNVVKKLVEKGAFAFVEVPENVESLSDDEVLELHEKELEAKFDAQVKSWQEDLEDPEAKAIAHIAKGGKIADFAKTYFTDNTIPLDLDISKEANQQKVIRAHYKGLEWTDEEIDDTLELLKEKGKTETEASKLYKTYQKTKLAEQKALEQELEESREAEKANRTKYNNNLLGKLKEAADVFGLPISKKDKEELPTYMTRATVKVGENRFVSGFHKDLNDALKDPEQVIALAKFLKTKFKALEEVEKKGGNKTLKQTKEKLRGQQTSQARRSTSGGGSKSLADMFPG